MQAKCQSSQTAYSVQGPKCSNCSPETLWVPHVRPKDRQESSFWSYFGLETVCHRSICCRSIPRFVYITTQDGDLKYTLYGVLVHAGWSKHSGHYYCFVRTSSGMWHSLDDNRVYQVSEKKVFEQKAYMLFYFRDRRIFPSKNTTNVHHKEKIVLNGAPNGPGAPREAQMKTGLSNRSLNAQSSLKKPADVAQQKENIVMSGAPNGPGAPRESQMKTGLSNRSLNAQSSLKKTVDVAQQKENIVMNGTPNGPGAPREAQMNTGLSNGSLNANMSLATVGIERNCLSSIASKETQTNTILSNSSLNDQKSLVSVSIAHSVVLVHQKRPKRA